LWVLVGSILVLALGISAFFIFRARDALIGSLIAQHALTDSFFRTIGVSNEKIPTSGEREALWELAQIDHANAAVRGKLLNRWFEMGSSSPTANAFMRGQARGGQGFRAATGLELGKEPLPGIQSCYLGASGSKGPYSRVRWSVKDLWVLRCTRWEYIFSWVEFGKLTTEFLTKFKVWISRQNESQAEIARRLGISRQALTDQMALRKRPSSETLLKMQEMMKKRPRKKKTTAACRIEESAGNRFPPEADPFVPSEFQRKYGHLFMIWTTKQDNT
jgi:predicted XRE-type DNA-binding protein